MSKEPPRAGARVGKSYEEGHRPQNPKGPLRIFRDEKVERVEVQIQEAVLAGPSKGRMFLLSIPPDQVKHADYLRAMWDHVWKAINKDPPQLLVMTADMELTSLTDDQLLAIGLMRIEKPYEKETKA